jgi:hypothetical protein
LHLQPRVPIVASANARTFGYLRTR